jgi:hypothetical protein
MVWLLTDAAEGVIRYAPPDGVDAIRRVGVLFERMAVGNAPSNGELEAASRTAAQISRTAKWPETEAAMDALGWAVIAARGTAPRGLAEAAAAAARAENWVAARKVDEEAKAEPRAEGNDDSDWAIQAARVYQRQADKLIEVLASR